MCVYFAGAGPVPCAYAARAVKEVLLAGLENTSPGSKNDLALNSCGAFSLHSLSAFGLPTCFFNTGDLSFVCQFTEADTADSIFSQISVRTSADPAAAVLSCREFRLALLFDFH